MRRPLLEIALAVGDLARPALADPCKAAAGP
jgi:hypothetical protein